jgi:hypothetical protein
MMLFDRFILVVVVVVVVASMDHDEYDDDDVAIVRQHRVDVFITTIKL